MTYEDQVAIGINLNEAIARALRQADLSGYPELVASIAQTVLVQLDQAGYQIVKK